MQELPPLGVDKDMPILRKNRLSTGIKELDIILEGGYQNPSNMIIMGPTGMEKNAFAFHYLGDGLKSKKDAVLVVLIDGAPQSLKDKSSSIGIELTDENIFFIDCYSSTLGMPVPDATKQLIYVPGPSALEDMSVAIKEVINRTAGRKLRVVFYSLSSLMLYNPKESLVKFLQVVGGRLKNAEATTLFLVEEGVHDKQFLGMVEHGMDDKLTIHDKGGSFELELQALGISLPIKLGPNGISIV